MRNLIGYIIGILLCFSADIGAEEAAKRSLVFEEFYWVADSTKHTQVRPDSTDVNTRTDSTEVLPAGVDTIHINKPYRDRYAGDKVPFMEGDRKYSLQKRYLKRGKPFIRKYFYDHFFIGGSVGGSWIVPKGGMVTRTGMPLSIFVGNDFTPVHAVRLTFTANTFLVPDYGRDIKQLGLDIDYMFNLSSYFNGYNPDRIFSVSPTLGIGGMRSHFYGKRNMVYKGQAGLQLALHIGRNAKVFAEPFFTIATDQIDHSGTGNSENYDIQYGIKGGLSFRFGSEKDFNQGTNYNGNIFFDLSQGASFYNSETLPTGKTLGTGYAVAVGKWFDPVVGLRLAFSATDFLWENRHVAATEAVAGYDRHFRAALLAGRIEALVNPLNFSKKLRQKQRPFDLNVAIGAEIGCMKKNIAGENPLNCKYVGVTAALQGLYNVNPSTSVFVEPRLLVARYTIPYQNVPREEKYTDRVGMLSAGVRFTRPTAEERKVRVSGTFEPYWTSSVHFGGLKRITHTKTVAGKGLNYSAGLTGAYHIAPLVGVRVGVDYMSYFYNKSRTYEVSLQGSSLAYKAMWKNRASLLTFHAGYMLNLTQLYQGYDSSRKLNLSLILGPSYTLCVGEKNELYEKELKVGTHAVPTDRGMDGDASWGLTGGFTADYRLSAHWSLFAEPQFVYFFKDRFVSDSRNKINDVFIKFNIGTTYRF